ncbi:MAG: COX15/CtaA family protein [Actinomycetota bacterium]
MRISAPSYLRVSQAAFAALYAIIITGSLVRLTGSGLGCADWPQCSESKFIDVSTGHAAIEQINRLFTGVVALSVIACAMFSFALRPKRRDLVGMSVVLVLGVLAQVLIGAVVVLTGLNPYSNIAHFLVSIFLMSVAYMLVQHAKIFKASDEPVLRGEPLLASNKTAQAVKVLLALTGLVIVVGTLVTGSGPHAGDEKAVRLGFAMTDIVRVHGIAVWLTVIAFFVVAMMSRKTQVARSLLGRPLARFGVVLVAQAVVGYAQYFLGVPVVLVAIHVAMSVLVWLAALDVYWHSRLSAMPSRVLDL